MSTPIELIRGRQTDRALTIMLVAVEPSADEIGAATLRELKAIAPAGSRFIGCGGPAMEAEGFQSDFPISPLSVIGFSDVVRALPLGLRRARELAERACDEAVDVVVFIDGWAFSRVAAKRFRALAPHTTRLKFVAPQIWASRPHRVEFVRTHFDGVLALLPFEPPLFERAGVRAAFVGNPNFQRAFMERGNGAAFRARHALGAGPVLAVLLGSRVAEVRRLGPPFREAVARLCALIPELRIVSPLAPAVADQAREMMFDWPGRPVLVATSEKDDLFAAADVALAASGTATTEIAINETPVVVAYRIDPFSAFMLRPKMIIPYVSILNVAAGAFVIPEFIQEKCDPVALADAVGGLLRDPKARAAQLAAVAPALRALRLDGPPAAACAARLILDWIDLGKQRGGKPERADAAT